MPKSKSFSQNRTLSSEKGKNLLERIDSGDQEAFEAIYRKYYSPLFNYVLPYVLEKEMAEEVLQDLFMNIWKKRGSLTSIQKFEAYLYQAARNHAINHIKSQKRPIASEDGVWDKTNHTEYFLPDDELMLKNLREAAASVIKDLPPVGQKAYVLIREEGKTYKEAAKDLGVSISTIQTHVERAIKKLRTHLSDYL